jgi:hypothetical protein
MAGGIVITVVLIVLMVARYRRDTATQVASKEAYLAEAQRLSHTGSFGWSAQSGFVWSDETFRIFGVDRTTIPGIETVIEQPIRRTSSGFASSSRTRVAMGRIATSSTAC